MAIQYGFAHGWSVQADLVDLDVLKREAVLRPTIAWASPQRTEFQFEAGELPPFEFVFGELTLAQFTFLAGMVMMTRAEPPRCLKATPWRAT